MKKFVSVLAAAAITLGTTAAYAAPADDAEDIVISASVLETVYDEDAFDNTAAEKMYIENLFGYGESPTYYANHGGEFLTGDAKGFYETLLPVIKDIADGKTTRTDGIAATYETDFPADGKEMLECMAQAISALKNDYPELFYWYGNMYGYNGWYPSLKIMNINLTVSKDYSKSGTVGTYEINTSKMDRARTAVANAKTIAEKYSGMRDYEKIYKCAEEVCTLTDYNYAAANNSATPYGDPWQLVDVFDGDPSTKVVCEGYAKAFQHLCDLGNVECCGVTGSNSIGAHMWNIVVLDGKSYHVDCTWADGFNIEAVKSYHPYILRGVAESDGTGVKFNFTVPGYQPTIDSLTYDARTIALYPQSILKVSTEDYVPKNVEEGGDKEDDKGDENEDDNKGNENEEEVTATEIKVEVNLPETNAPDASGLSVQIADGEPIAIIDNKLDITTLDDGDYKMTFSANNCAPRTYTVKIENSTANLGSVKLNLIGDINGDGKLTLGDVLKANAAARNSKPLTGYEKVVSDINGDGNITLGDVLKMNAHARNSKLLW